MNLVRFALTIALLSPLTHAAALNFTAAGNFVNGGTLSGLVSIDTTTGLIGGADLRFPGTLPISQPLTFSRLGLRQGRF